MPDSYFLAHAAPAIDAPGQAELEQRLGLYRVFLKLYEHHRVLLNEILGLEHLDASQTALRYVQATVQAGRVCLSTNLSNQPQTIQQEQMIWIIGRDRKAAISIQDLRLSRHHAAIQYIENDGFYLVDLNGTNGSFVNGKPVQQAISLNHGDQVRLGSLIFIFFISTGTRVSELLPPKLLNQVNTIRQSAPVVQKRQFDGAAAAKLDTTPDSSNQTAKLPISPMAAEVNLSYEPLLSSAQQAIILDRFLKR